MITESTTKNRNMDKSTKNLSDIEKTRSKNNKNWMN